MPTSAPGRWLAIFPDSPPAAGPAQRLRARACHVLGHASGRPWLLGCWDPGQTRMLTLGPARIMITGPGAADVTADPPAGVRDAADVERLVRDRAGSFHVLASLDGEVYARGDRSGVRPLYRCLIGGVTVLADRAHTLAWLGGAAVEPAALAARLAGGLLPYPLDETPMWRGAELVEPGQAARVGRDGTCLLRPGPPAPSPVGSLPLTESAVLLRRALERAVSVRVRAGEAWGADLSGGMDSTSLCFLAAQAGATLTAVTLDWSGARNEDARYARLAAAHLPGLTHLTFPSARLPLLFTGIARPRAPGDTPTGALRDRARQDHLTAVLAERGVHQRLSGHGGDHLVTPPTSYLQPLTLRRPLTALRHTAAHRARLRWSLARSARMLLPQPSYATWLRTQATRLHGPDVRDAWAAGPAWGWGPPLTLPPWVTGDAVELLADALRAAADDAGPLARGAAEHAWRHQARQAARTGVHPHRLAPLHTPFCDAEVLDACLSVRPHEAGTPWSYKPLLATAMRGLVPEEILTRTTKDNCAADWYAGLKAHQRELATWAEDSHLVAAGLADPGALREALLSPGLAQVGCGVVEATLAVEAWLRDLTAHPEPACLTGQCDLHPASDGPFLECRDAATAEP